MSYISEPQAKLQITKRGPFVLITHVSHVPNEVFDGR